VKNGDHARRSHIVCFAFRTTLVQVMQGRYTHRIKRSARWRALGVTDSIVIFVSTGLLPGIVLSFPLAPYFIAEFVLPALTAVEKRFSLPAIFVSFALFLPGVRLYFWLLPKTILFFFRDTQSLGWTPTGQCSSTIPSPRVHARFGLAFECRWSSCFGAIRLGHLPIHGGTRPYAVVLIFILATIITPNPTFSP